MSASTPIFAYTAAGRRQMVEDARRVRRSKLETDRARLQAELTGRINALRNNPDGPEMFASVAPAFDAYLGASENVGTATAMRSAALEAGDVDPSPGPRVEMLEMVREHARAHWHAALVVMLSYPYQPTLADLIEFERLGDKIAKKAYMQAMLQVQEESSENWARW